MSADLATLHRMLAAADGEGLPQPLGTRVDNVGRLHVHLDTAEDRSRWQEWFSRHHVDEDWTAGEDEQANGFRHHHVRAVWRGWHVELVHLTPVEPEAGVESDG